jgi:hypothetical protein
VSKSLLKLKKNDWKLLKSDVNERSITHKLAIYLQENFPNFDVDCEYNRDGLDPKILNLPVSNILDNDTEAKTVFPDIIIHERGTNNNILVIEVKKSSNRNSNGRTDEEKLYAYIQQLGYRFGLFIKLYVGEEYVKLPEIKYLRYNLDKKD